MYAKNVLEEKVTKRKRLLGLFFKDMYENSELRSFSMTTVTVVSVGGLIFSEL